MIEIKPFNVFEDQSDFMEIIENRQSTWFREDDFVPQIVNHIIEENSSIAELYAKIGYSVWFPRRVRILLEHLSILVPLLRKDLWLTWNSEIGLPCITGEVIWISSLGIPAIVGEVEPVFEYYRIYRDPWHTRRTIPLPPKVRYELSLIGPQLFINNPLTPKKAFIYLLNELKKLFLEKTRKKEAAREESATQDSINSPKPGIGEAARQKVLDSISNCRKGLKTDGEMITLLGILNDVVESVLENCIDTEKKQQLDDFLRDVVRICYCRFHEREILNQENKYISRGGEWYETYTNADRYCQSQDGISHSFKEILIKRTGEYLANPWMHLPVFTIFLLTESLTARISPVALDAKAPSGSKILMVSLGLTLSAYFITYSTEFRSGWLITLFTVITWLILSYWGLRYYRCDRISKDFNIAHKELVSGSYDREELSGRLDKLVDRGLFIPSEVHTLFALRSDLQILGGTSGNTPSPPNPSNKGEQ